MPRLNDLTGQRFGMLTVIKRDDDYICPSGRRKTHWLCQCDCGNISSVDASNLVKGASRSCGCMIKVYASIRNRTHHEAKTKLYGVWSAMKSRCYNQNNTSYARYGGRGITVCDEWKNDFLSFKRWMYDNGYSDTANGHDVTIDRINNDRGYSPDNCRIADVRTQSNNRSSNRLFTYNGETHNIGEWSKLYHIEYKKLHRRLSSGWDMERALTT